MFRTCGFTVHILVLQYMLFTVFSLSIYSYTLFGNLCYIDSEVTKITTVYITKFVI